MSSPSETLKSEMSYNRRCVQSGAMAHGQARRRRKPCLRPIRQETPTVKRSTALTTEFEPSAVDCACLAFAATRLRLNAVALGRRARGFADLPSLRPSSEDRPAVADAAAPSRSSRDSPLNLACAFAVVPLYRNRNRARELRRRRSRFRSPRSRSRAKQRSSPTPLRNAGTSGTPQYRVCTYLGDPRNPRAPEPRNPECADRRLAGCCSLSARPGAEKLPPAPSVIVRYVSTATPSDGVTIGGVRPLASMRRKQVTVWRHQR